MQERFPEFLGVSEPQMVDHLDDAELRIDPDVFGPRTASAVRLLAAHTLALTPFGQSAKLVGSTGTTVYGVELKQMRLECSIGWRVVL